MKLPRVIEYRFPKPKPRKKKTCGDHVPGRIRIDPRQTPRDYLDTLLHEGLHEFAPYLDEPAVYFIADCLEQLVTRAGYRRIYAPGKRCGFSK